MELYLALQIQYEIIPMNWMGRDYLGGKSRGSKEGPIGSGRYELPVPDKKKTCKRQNKKSWQYNDNLDKWMVWKGAASVHGWIEVESVWDTIRWAQCDSRNAGHKNADDDKQNYIFFIDIHITTVERFRVWVSALRASTPQATLRV